MGGKVGLREVVWKKGGLREGDLGEGDLRKGCHGPEWHWDCDFIGELLGRREYGGLICPKNGQ